MLCVFNYLIYFLCVCPQLSVCILFNFFAFFFPLPREDSLKEAHAARLVAIFALLL